MPRPLKEGFSTITAVKDRPEPLRYSLPSWIDCPEINQIVLIDWGSKIPLIDTLAEMEIPGYPDPRIVIGRVEAESWRSSDALNVAISYYIERTTCVKLDADVVIVNEEIFNLDASKLHVGHWQDSTKLNRNYLTGSFVTSTQNLWGIGGYDQNLSDSYGFEDDDLYARLEANGVVKSKMPLHYLYHLPHRDKKRFENFLDPDISIKDKWAQWDALEKWGRKDSANIRYRHTKIRDGYYQSTPY